jgi:two-component system, OmpR family, heavy metal sensor histidine kinase CusS
VIAASRSLSIAARLVLLFVTGSAVIMAGAGYALYHALRMQLEAQDYGEVTGKTEVVEYVLREIESPAALEANLNRLRDISIGHPHLNISVLYAGRWLVPPRDDLLALATRATESAPSSPSPSFEARSDKHIWLVHRVRHSWTAGEPGHADVVVAVETTETYKLLREHAAVAVIVGLLGTAASALLAWFVARRALAPLAQVASRAGQVTAQRLGARLDLEDAPLEVQGLAVSINRMLERLEESFHTLEQFSADIAHELRTPLNNLLLQTQVTLTRQRTSDEYQEALHSNLAEIERLQRMISEMLFLARADRGMIDLEEEDIDVAAEVRSVAEYFEAAAAERGQSIAIHGHALRRGDRMLLRRALTNLLSNAVRYSPQAASIRVAIESSPAGVSIAVTNPGDAIPEQELQRLFARFARRDESRTRAREGVGLGLAIVDSIMKAQKGSVEGRSEGGQITFTLRLPR